MERRRRRYTAKEKARAVGMATLEGVTETERRTGIPKTTVQYWMDSPQFAQLRTKTRDQVADEMWATIQVGVKRIVELIPQTDDLGKVGVATGILYDKHALLTGGATGRTESRDLTGTLSDSDIIDAVKIADGIARGRSVRTPEETPDPTEG